jgi:hypothetical protein
MHNEPISHGRLRLVLLPLVLSFFLTGCHTYTQAPGAVGKVVDAETGAAVIGARITRTPVAGGVRGAMGVPPEGLPAVTIFSVRTGEFNLPPALHTQLAFMYLHNPKTISGSFLVTADGYETNELRGIATSRNRWRADLGRVPLKKP